VDKEQVHLAQPALEATLLDYVHEVDHLAERIERLERSIDVAIEKAPAEMRAVIEALQALRGVAKGPTVASPKTGNPTPATTFDIRFLPAWKRRTRDNLHTHRHALPSFRAGPTASTY
jgi:hypothetical protein